MADETRGTNQQGKPDAHTKTGSKGLPPPNPNFQPSKARARAQLVLDKVKPRHRTETLFPYLMIRSVPGDAGARPLAAASPAWECCDIHLMPAGSGGFDFARTVLKPVAGQTYRVFVHIWNLGRFAAYGARVKAWWVEPGFFPGVAGPSYQTHYIGGAYFDLGDRDSGDSHRLIEVKPAWTVGANFGGHESLIAGVEAATDPWDGVMQPSTHRHAALRSLALATGTDDIAGLVSTLASKITATDQEVLISHGGVERVSLAGAHARGLSTNANPPGWNHSGVFNFTSDWRPLAGVRRFGQEWRFFDLSHLGTMPIPGSMPLPGSMPALGVPMFHVAQDLPVHLREVLHATDLKASSIRQALALRADTARALRFQTSEQLNVMSPGHSGGYSILVAP